MFPRGPLISASSDEAVTFGRKDEGPSGGLDICRSKHETEMFSWQPRTMELTVFFFFLIFLILIFTFISGAGVTIEGLVHSRQTLFHRDTP